MNKHILMGALALVLPLAGVNAQEKEVAVTSTPSANKGFFAYGDYYQYTGAGSTGAYMARVENKANVAFIETKDVLGSMGYSIVGFENAVSKTPSGNLGGGVLGYSMSTSSGENFVFQFAYRSGSIDYSSPDGYMRGTRGGFNLDSSVSKKYKQDIDEYRAQATWYPRQLGQHLALSIEYMHGDNSGAFTALYDYKISAGSSSLKWFDELLLKNSSRSDDVLLHFTLKPSSFVLFRGNTSSIGFVPRADFGAGYSLRSADEVKTYSYKNSATTPTLGVFDGAKEYLSEDAWVFEGTATLGFYYQLNPSNTFIFDAGYRYKTELDSDDYGTDQKGIYGRVGYTFTW